MKIPVIETPEFISKAKKIFSAEEINKLIDYISDYPEAGNIMEDTGGLRKLRWVCGNKGKSGGARIVYFYYNKTLPLFLFSTYSKSDSSDLSLSET